jgi:hypothetical protein
MSSYLFFFQTAQDVYIDMAKSDMDVLLSDGNTISSESERVACKDVIKSSQTL